MFVSVRVLGVAVLLAAGALACQPMDYDLNDAVLQITPEGEGESTLTHEPGRSEVRVTPPVGGAFTATFSYLEPQVELLIAVEDSQLGEEQDQAFPLDPGRVDLRVSYGSEEFAATSPAADGYLTIERLDVDDEQVSFRASFQGTIGAEDGTRAAISGFIDALYDGRP